MMLVMASVRAFGQPSTLGKFTPTQKEGQTVCEAYTVVTRFCMKR